MNKLHTTLALAGLALASGVNAIPTNQIQLWTGCGTNHAAMVVEWNCPLVSNYSTVPAPIANKTMVWGYKFNGSATGTEMLDAILAADRRLYAIVDNTYGTFVEGIGYNLSGDGHYGVTDGTGTYPASAFVNGNLLNSAVNPDTAAPLNSGDLFWSGYFGPNWNVWNELNQTGGYSASPNRGTNQYASWDSVNYVWTHGQWESSYAGLDELYLQDGSWIGFSVAAAGYDTNAGDIATVDFTNAEQAPPSPDGTYVAYVCNTNDFATQIISTTNLYPNYPYNNAEAVLGHPTLRFVDEGLVERTKIPEDPYNVAPDGSDVITEIRAGGEITIQMGRKVYHNPGNPYGTDFIVYGNSFFGGGLISDETDLDNYDLTSPNGHPTSVSVSQDGVNWYTYPTKSLLFPDDAYYWDEPSHSWTDQQMDPNKPLNPFIYTNNFNGLSCASALDQFIGAAGGTGFNLAASGLPWIQYVRVQPGAGTYTVIDAIAAVNPRVVGDALSIMPDNLAAGLTNLSFENPANDSETSISINFHSVSEIARVSTISLTEFSAYAPVPGYAQEAYQLQILPVSGTNPPIYLADVALNAGTNYSGDGSDLRLLQWAGRAWTQEAFTFNSTNNQVCLTSVTNLSAFVITKLGAQLAIKPSGPGFNFTFTPFQNATYDLQRSTDLTNWASIGAVTSSNMQPLTLSDSAPPAAHAFYRLQLTP